MSPKMFPEESTPERNDESSEAFQPLDAITRVVNENGRWVVYLNVTSWSPDDDDHPIENNWKRINDYSSPSQAKVAASWIERSANRNIRPPDGF